jgi:hypothetical protein
MKRVMTFPIIGEFGWIVPDIAPHVRTWLLERRDCRRVVICSPYVRFLFEEADEFLDPPRIWLQKVAVGRWIWGHSEMPRLLREWWDQQEADEKLLPPIQKGGPLSASEKDWLPLKPTYRLLLAREELRRKARQYAPFVAVICRQRMNMPHKNWGPDNWDQLVEWLKKEFGWNVLVAGGTQSYFPKGAIKTGVGVEESVAVFNEAEFSVSSNSGGTHLSTMAGCPGMSWGPQKLRLLGRRMELESNPLGAFFRYSSYLDWYPPIGWVRERVRKFWMELQDDRATAGAERTLPGLREEALRERETPCGGSGCIQPPSVCDPALH